MENVVERQQQDATPSPLLPGKHKVRKPLVVVRLAVVATILCAVKPQAT
jgi:hypothetical protein